MDKELVSSTHNVTITGRKNIVISGVKKIESFDEKEFLIDSVMGFIDIKGSDLEIIKLDTFQGDVTIKGKIDSLVYLETSNKKNKSDSIFNKLFK